MNYKPFTPTPLQKAVDEILERVYQAERNNESVEISLIKEMESKYQVFNQLKDRLIAENLVGSARINAFYITLCDNGRKVQEQGGYIAVLEKQDKQEQDDQYAQFLDIQDKEGAIADRKFNRRLSWAAIIISLGTLIWTVYHDSLGDSDKKVKPSITVEQKSTPQKNSSSNHKNIKQTK